MHILNALPIVAASYGDKFGVQVVVGGTDAYTDGSRIVIPNLNLKEQPELEDALWGYLSHEAAHVKFTDFSVDIFDLPPIGRSIDNLIEDVWIENALIEDLPGTRFTMDQTLQYVIDNQSGDAQTQTQNPAHVLFSYLWNWLRCEYRDQLALRQARIDSEKLFKSVFPAELCRELEQLITVAMPAVKSTQAASQLTRDILDLIRKYLPSEDDSEERQTGENQSDNSTEGDEQSDTDESQSVEIRVTAEKGDDDSSDDDSEGSDSAEASGSTDETSGSSGQTGDEHDACQVALDATEDQIGEGLGEILKKILEANAVPQTEGSELPELSYDSELCPKGDEALIQDGVAQSSKLRAKLTGLIQAKQMRKSWHSSQGRHIDPRRIDRLLSGDTRIFSQESQRKGPNTDVCVLLDSSGSMRHGQGAHTIANPACASLALALGEIQGVDVCGATFPGNATEVGPIIPMGSQVRGHLSRFAVAPFGGTPLTEALLWSVKELSKGKRERKVVLVVTDGEPNNSFSARLVIDRMEKSGIHLVGVGIRSSAVADCFKHHVVIDNLEDLGPKLFDIAQEII